MSDAHYTAPSAPFRTLSSSLDSTYDPDPLARVAERMVGHPLTTPDWKKLVPSRFTCLWRAIRYTWFNLLIAVCAPVGILIATELLRTKTVCAIWRGLTSLNGWLTLAILAGVPVGLIIGFAFPKMVVQRFNGGERWTPNGYGTLFIRKWIDVKIKELDRRTVDFQKARLHKSYWRPAAEVWQSDPDWTFAPDTDLEKKDWWLRDHALLAQELHQVIDVLDRREAKCRQQESMCDCL